MCMLRKAAGLDRQLFKHTNKSLLHFFMGLKREG